MKVTLALLTRESGFEDFDRWRSELTDYYVEVD